jgi:hypothetical protein
MSEKSTINQKLQAQDTARGVLLELYVNTTHAHGS